MRGGTGRCLGHKNIRGLRCVKSEADQFAHFFLYNLTLQLAGCFFIFRYE